MSATQQILLSRNNDDDEAAIWSNVVALYHGEGTNGGTTFTDSSSFNHSTNNLVQNVTTSTTRSRYGSSCIATSSSSDVCWAILTGSTALCIRPTWTIEFSFWADSTLFTHTKNCAVMSRNNVSYFNLNSNSGSITVNQVNMGMGSISATISSPFDRWIDVCMVRDATNTRASIYIDGVRAATTTSLSSWPTDAASYNLNILGFSSNNYGGRGIFLDECRFTQDQALHRGASYTLQGSAFPDS